MPRSRKLASARATRRSLRELRLAAVVQPRLATAAVVQPRRDRPAANATPPPAVPAEHLHAAVVIARDDPTVNDPIVDGQEPANIEGPAPPTANSASDDEHEAELERLALEEDAAERFDRTEAAAVARMFRSPTRRPSAQRRLFQSPMHSAADAIAAAAIENAPTEPYDGSDADTPAPALSRMERLVQLYQGDVTEAVRQRNRRAGTAQDAAALAAERARQMHIVDQGLLARRIATQEAMLETHEEYRAMDQHQRYAVGMLSRMGADSLLFDARGRIAITGKHAIRLFLDVQRMVQNFAEAAANVVASVYDSDDDTDRMGGEAAGGGGGMDPKRARKQ